MAKPTYAEKLKDPRWQKKRLEILERDKWCCQRCLDGENTLHVHHLRYFPGRDPWDYDNKLLITLCAECHENEKESRPCNESDLLDMLKEQGFMAEDLHCIASGIHLLESRYLPEITATIIEKTLADPVLWEKACAEYFESIKSEGEENGTPNKGNS